METPKPFASRKSARLEKFDYSSPNYYFVTVCTHEKHCIFGTIEALNPLGKIAREELLAISSYYPNVRIDNCIVMTNHIHSIIIMDENQKNGKSTTLADVICGYKSGVSRKIRLLIPKMTVWQRSFHDHIIRDQKSYEKIWNYIQYNAQKWEQDCFYPGNANS